MFPSQFPPSSDPPLSLSSSSSWFYFFFPNSPSLVTVLEHGGLMDWRHTRIFIAKIYSGNAHHHRSWLRFELICWIFTDAIQIQEKSPTGLVASRIKPTISPDPSRSPRNWLDLKIRSSLTDILTSSLAKHITLLSFIYLIKFTSCTYKLNRSFNQLYRKKKKISQIWIDVVSLLKKPKFRCKKKKKN